VSSAATRSARLARGPVVALDLPLTEVSSVGDLAVHAEEWRPGGEIARGTDVGAAELSARLYAASESPRVV